jgi:L-ascorbate metabolism protein UlaG (beta-lactamase superfamily)
MPLQLTYLGHSGFLLDDGQPKGKVVIDPFLSGNAKAKHKPGDLTADFVCFTHGHGDHYNSDGLSIAKRCGATVIANFEICQDASHNGIRKTEPGNPGGKIQTPFGSVAFTPAIHSSSGDDGRYLGFACGLVVWFERANVTVYHAGDTALFSDMKLIGDWAHPHVALLPAGDRYTMGPKLAARAAELIRPKLAIPIHYNTFPPIEVDITQFKPAGVPTKLLSPGEMIQIN